MPSPGCGRTEAGVRSRYRDCDQWPIPSQCSGHNDTGLLQPLLPWKGAMTTLFDSDSLPPSHERLEEGAVLLRGFATSEAPALLEEVARIAQAAPFRHLITRGGYTMSVAMTNCGRVGWVSDNTGYRYDRMDPDSRAPWPAMPGAFLDRRARRRRGRVCPLRSRRLSNQPLHRWRQARSPSRP
jgi:hypothetical protein